MYQNAYKIKIKWQKHKQEHHIMQVHKYGETSHIIINVIYGHMDVFCIKCVLFNLHFKEMILINFITMYKKENINLYHQFIRINYQY